MKQKFYEAFKKIIESLHNMELDVNMLISDALEGKLDTRAKIDKHEGDYRQIIVGVNNMLDTVKAPLDVASNFISNLASGVKQDEIRNTYNGYYSVLIENLRYSLNTLTDETKKLEKAGLCGEFDIRGDENKPTGFLADIIHGVTVHLIL